MGFSSVGVSILALAISNIVHCERLHEQIYSSVEGGAACFRRLNGTHQAGCSSADNGAVGIVHMIYNVSDAEWLAHNSTAGPYMAIVSTALFQDVVELLMGHSKKVAGVLIYDSVTVKASSFTQESRCPNEYASGPESKCSSQQVGGSVWNEKGTGLLRRDIPFPMFFLSKARAEEIVKIEECFLKFNLDRANQEGMPLCSLQLNSFMFAAVDTRVCLRRSASSVLMTPTKVCDPLGDYNVYYSLFPRIKETPTTKKPVTLVTARIDTATLFDGVSPGAASAVVGLVTLITAASALANMIPVADAHLYNHNILWTLFNGEAFDYIGSQRVAHDMAKGAWPPAAPLAPADVALHLELGQLGGALRGAKGGEWPLSAFVPSTIPVSQVSEFLNEMVKNTNIYNISVDPKFTPNVPPSSLHSFRRLIKEAETGELPEVLLVDHENAFTNMFYNSPLDDSSNIAFKYHNISIGSNGTFMSTEELLEKGNMTVADIQVKISRLSTAVARTLYQKVTGQSYAANFTASAHLVDEMLYCFLESQACRLLLAADYAQSGGREDEPPAKPPSLYVGVAAWAGTSAVFAGHLLALLTGVPLQVNRTGCDAQRDVDYSYYWLRGWNHTGVCIQTTMNFSQAVSPAFVTPDYDFTSGMYSSWTESVWTAMWARVFVSASGAGARAAGVAGGVATALAALAVFWLRRHAAMLFADPGCNDAATGILRTVNC